MALFPMFDNLLLTNESGLTTFTLRHVIKVEWKCDNNYFITEINWDSMRLWSLYFKRTMKLMSPLQWCAPLMLCVDVNI